MGLINKEDVVAGLEAEIIGLSILHQDDPFALKVIKLIADARDFVYEWEETDPIHYAGGCYCKECKNWNEEIAWCEEHSYFMNTDGMPCSPQESSNWKMFHPDEFCSFGRRREGAE